MSEEDDEGVVADAAAGGHELYGADVQQTSLPSLMSRRSATCGANWRRRRPFNHERDREIVCVCVRERERELEDGEECENAYVCMCVERESKK